MIYTYQYINHPIEDFHKHVMYFFEILLYHEPKAFDLNYHIKASFKDEVIAARVVLFENFKEIVIRYNKLTPNQKDKLKEAFSTNNIDLFTICNDTQITPLKFEELGLSISDKDFLKEFFLGLWKKLKTYSSDSINWCVQDHFNKFIEINERRGLICPFCGLDKLKPSSGSPNIKDRNDYDHIAAEASYPFLSVNIQNLAPICKECNSDEKRSNDPFYDKAGIRRLVLYPYDISYREEELDVSIIQNNMVDPDSLGTLLKSIDWNIVIEHEGVEKEFLRTWDDVFGIKERYSKYLMKFETEWYTFLINKYIREKRKGISFEDYADEVLVDLKNDIKVAPLGILKYVYCRFLLSKDSFKSYLDNL